MIGGVVKVSLLHDDGHAVGDFTFAEGNGGRIRITSEEPGIHADGILFVKK